MLKITNTGRNKFEATNGFDTFRVEGKRCRYEFTKDLVWFLVDVASERVYTARGDKMDAIAHCAAYLTMPNVMLPMTGDAMIDMEEYELSNGYIHGIVPVTIEELTGNDHETFLALIAERLTGSKLLTDVKYNVVGHDGNTLHIRVSGDANAVIRECFS